MTPIASGRPAAPSSRPRRSARRTLLGAGLVVLLAVAIAAALTFCAKTPRIGPGGADGGMGRRGGVSGGPGGRPPVTVGVATASLGPMPIELSGLGTVTPLATVSVNARVSGQLETVAFREGQSVRRGQLLAVIDPRPFEVALRQAQAQLAHDQAAAQTAQLDLKRYQALHAQDAIAGQVYDTQVSAARQAEAVVAADQAAVASARLNLDFTRLTSPVAGRVGLRQIDPGNQVAANQTTPVAVVTQLSPITVVFTLPQAAIGQVMARHGGQGLPVTAYDRAGGVVLARGVLQTLDNQIDPTTGTVKAKALFDNADAGLFPNQFVNIVLLVDTLQNQVVAPTSAVRHGPQGEFVWVLQADRTVRSRPVTIGPVSPETVAVAAGLRPGEQVITDGGDRLRDGSKVVLPGAEAAAGPGSGGERSAGQGHRRHGARPGGGGSGPAQVAP